MKKIFPLIAMVFAVLIAYFIIFYKKDKPKIAEQTKEVSLVLKKHTDAFNNNIDSIIDTYLQIKNAFVDADTATAKSATLLFISKLQALPIEELKKDTTSIYETAKSNLEDIKANANSLLTQTDITEMRKDFSMITEMLYPSFLTTIKYEGKKLYVAQCPMAFDETTQANWISNSNEIVNPYLGKNHPKYKAGMLNCGEVVDSIYAK